MIAFAGMRSSAGSRAGFRELPALVVALRRAAGLPEGEEAAIA